MRAFLELLPRNTAGAAALARRRDAFMKGRTRLGIDANRPLRYAIEIRNDSFLNPSFIDLLRAHRVAAVIAETARRWPMIQDVTALGRTYRPWVSRSMWSLPVAQGYDRAATWMIGCLTDNRSRPCIASTARQERWDSRA